MSLRQLSAGVYKEALLLVRDWHALGLLFAMPLAFVLVMSLAMQDQFAARAGSKLSVVLLDQDQSNASKALVAVLQSSGAANIRVIEERITFEQLKDTLRSERHAFAIGIAAGYGTALSDANAALSSSVTLFVAPDTSKQTEMIFQGSLRETLARERLNALFAPLAMLSRAQGGADIAFDSQTAQPSVEYLYRANAVAGQVSQAPSAVQQSVPAWLVFGAFFIVIPLSNTLIRERQQGTARRLRTLPIGQGVLLAGKLAPYFVVNQLQVVLMLLAGLFLVPALGGEALQLNGSMWALAAIGGAISFAAIGYALLIASVARTTEQASLLGGAGNLILAAIGGILVPKFVMPEGMQTLANFSPMAWGLDGFLDVLLRDGTLRDVANEVTALVVFGIAMLGLAWWVQARRLEK
jgi:ABC-2 type transport system permease protein